MLFSLRAKYLVLQPAEKLPGTERSDAENRSVMIVYESGLRKSQHVSNYRQHNPSADLKKLKE